MNEHERSGDPAFDRLVAADPARSAPEPAAGVLRARVDALLAASGETPATSPGAPGRPTAPGTGAEEERAGVDELAVRRHRRRAPWLVAAAVAGFVVVGGGGYLAGEAGLGAPAADQAVSAGSSAQEDSGAGPSVLGAPESGAEDVGPLDGPAAELPTAEGTVFHAGAALSDAPATGEVSVAGTGASLGAYPLVSEVAAVERLGDPRFAASVLGPGPGAGGQAREHAGGAPTPDGALAWPVRDVTLVTAELTRARWTAPDGTELLVPAYRLADADGSTWTVVAVDEERLDLAP
ncbi:hypothetical protein ACFQBY_12030 [Promicromonospora citrea]|uniref:Uncharacterized protein n=1 Tax=Promicromonospora citrea TaxID=43677 RepID=A0A8H9L3G9_9MICO|nr:hypothetical protein [Promicromonospora citrea]GGM19600.1 hypothetical protein GCM10010102_13930 [Promicromonospora citrea]